MGTVTDSRQFDTKAEAEAFAAQYKRAWPPEGYGTDVTLTPVTPEDQEGKTRASIFRSDRCD